MPTNIFRCFVITLIGLTCCYTMASAKTANTHKPDSVYTEDYVLKISITEPEKALTLLNEMEARRLISESRLDLMRGIVYQNGYDLPRTSLIHNLKALNNKEMNIYTEDGLSLLELITDQYNTLGNYAESIRYAIKGIEIADKLGIVRAKANLLLYIGVNKRAIGLKSEAYKYVDRAIALQEKDIDDCKEWRKIDDLIFLYGNKITFALEDHDLKIAIDMLPRYDILMEKLKACPDILDGIYDMRYASAYAAYAYAFTAAGQPDKGDELFQKYLSTDYSSTKDGYTMRPDYLVAAKQYKEALRCLEKIKLFFQEDTLSEQYIECVLNFEVQAYMGMGDYKEAARIYKKIYDMSDSLQIRKLHNDVLDFATLYETQEKETQIIHQAAKLKEHTLFLVSALIVIILLLFLLWRIIRHARIVKSKNKTMVHTITELMNDKEELRKTKARMYALTSQLNILQPQTPEKDNQEDEEEREESIFEELNRIVTTEKLYLDPGLTRDDLVRRMHIDKNSFSQIFQEGANLKYNEYINNLRVEHAINLIQLYSEHTFQAIATDSGFSNMGTFYSAFKKKTGMTPAEFRSALLKHSAGT